MSEETRTNFTIAERLMLALGLAVALLGLINQALWERSLFGLEPRQLSIIGFIPLALLLYFVLQRPDPRSAE